jgi:hypothetical protein
MIPAADIERARTVGVEREVARRGGELRRHGAYFVGPCPVCGGDDRSAISVTKRLWHCRGCGTGGDVIDFVRHVDGCDFVAAINVLLGDVPRNQSLPANRETLRANQNNASTAVRLWSKRKPIAEGTPPWLYLRKRHYTGLLPATLGHLPRRDPYPAAMIAAFGIAEEPEPGMIAPPRAITGVHLTRLTTDGDKAPNDTGKAKIMVGVCKGAPITISPPNNLCGMAVTEGIEDGLSVYEGTGLGVWAAGSAVFMPALAALVPEYIETVTIYAHNDDAGRGNAIDLARAINARGIQVLVQGL